MFLRRSLSMRVIILIMICVAFPPILAAAASHGSRHSGTYHPECRTWACDRSGVSGPLTSGSRTGEGNWRDRSSPWTFSPNVRVHPEELGGHRRPDIAVAGDGTIGIAWMDDHADGPHIYFSSSGDDGLTWTAPERVDDRMLGSVSLWVSLGFTPSGKAVAVWEDDRTGSMNVYFSKRDPEGGGMPWTPAGQVSTAGSLPTADWMQPDLAVLDEQRYFVAWTDWREGDFHQVYSRGTWDEGATWGTEVRVSDGLGYQPMAGRPCLIVDPASGGPHSETLHCVTNDWRGDVPGGRFPNVRYYRSDDGGADWSIGVQVNDIEPFYQQVSANALVLLPDLRLACAWMD